MKVEIFWKKEYRTIYQIIEMYAKKQLQMLISSLKMTRKRKPVKSHWKTIRLMRSVKMAKQIMDKLASFN
ncbi:MAG: hypothetical protein QM426_05200 [Euryarchaeota archaeon]|nr:hypothetical protein [Euryarchaeota archaeon]